MWLIIKILGCPSNQRAAATIHGLVHSDSAVSKAWKRGRWPRIRAGAKRMLPVAGTVLCVRAIPDCLNKIKALGRWVSVIETLPPGPYPAIAADPREPARGY